MSLTSYRAAPPRDKPLRASLKTETDLATPEAPIVSGGFLRRRPGPKRVGASGMYERRCALERAASDLFGVLSRSKRGICRARRPARAVLPEVPRKPSLAANEGEGKRMTDTFDFVVVGGGSGGCAVASRLSEDPGTSVALLEAGGECNDWVVASTGAMILMISGKVNNWAFDTVPQAGLNGRIGYQPRGKGLGGSSAINAMVYIRGHRSDYDQWASLGNTGWSYADVLPYFKRSEDNSELDGEYHGKGGPLHVTGLRSDNPVREIYLQAAREAQFRIRDHAPFPRRRTKPAGSSGLCIRLPLGRPLFRRPVVCRHRANFQGDRAIPARASRADALEHRRMRRFPQNPPRPRRARYPVAFLHGDGERSRPQAALGHRLLLPCLPASAKEPRPRLAAKRRSAFFA